MIRASIPVRLPFLSFFLSLPPLCTHPARLLSAFLFFGALPALFAPLPATGARPLEADVAEAVVEAKAERERNFVRTQAALILTRPILVEAALEGDPDARAALGLAGTTGPLSEVALEEAELRPFEAARWIAAEAEAGDTDAQMAMAVLLVSGGIWGVEEDVEESIRWLTRAAEAGDAGAQLALARQFAIGSFVSHDPARAVALYRAAAEQGNAEAQEELGDAYSRGSGVARDTAEALVWWRRAAEQGQVEAQVKVGHAYAVGEGIEAQPAQALAWWHRAAAQGHARAYRALAVSYEDGFGVEVDLHQAFGFWTQAAFLGESVAMYHLARAYALGLGTEKDPNEEFAWLVRSAEAGHLDAQIALGRLYFDEKDAAQAARWFEAAAEAGSLYAMIRTAMHYFDGNGVEQNFAKGFALVIDPANAGNSVAQVALAMGYHFGDPGEGGLIQAHMWYTIHLAHSETFSLAARFFEEITSEMTPEQIARASALAAAWFDAHPDAPRPEAPAVEPEPDSAAPSAPLRPPPSTA